MTSATGAAPSGEPTPYAELGVSEDASADQITRAYRIAVRAVHPDLVSYPDARAESDAVSRLRRLNEAYTALTRRRSEVDRQLRAARGPAAAPAAGAAAPGTAGRPGRSVVRLTRRDWEVGRTIQGDDGVRLTVPPRTAPGPFRPFDRGRRIEVEVVHVDARGAVLPDGHDWDVDHLAESLTEQRRPRRWWRRR